MIEMAKHLLLVIFHVVLVITTVLVSAEDQEGFVSIDCGLSDRSNYQDKRTGITYSSDAAFVDTGINKGIASEFKTESLPQQFWNVRCFPEGIRNCYTLKLQPSKHNKYLIRASFVYGNYDSKGKVPEFDLLLGASWWDSVKVKDASSMITKEIIYMPTSDYTHVCLVNTNSGTPFISVLELRLLNNNTYTSKSGSLDLFGHLNCGAAKEPVRYEDDVYDRIWIPFNSENLRNLSTNLTINTVTHKEYLLPSVVMQTAITPTDANYSIEIHWNIDDNTAGARFYMYMHFAEIELLQENQVREFNIYVNDNLWHGPFSPSYLSSTTIYSVEGSVSTGSRFQVLINKTKHSTLPPLINAFEVYKVKELQQPQTDQDEVDAVMNIKLIYQLKKNWQGDPCAPQAYTWEGINCSYNGFDPPTIRSLNLSSHGLSGEIASYIFNLTMLQYLDLSNNSLNGAIPAFLSQMLYLKVLDLSRNHLSGSVPMELIERSKNGSLMLRVEGNQYPCSLLSCKKKNKIVIPLTISLGGSFIIFFTTLAILWTLKRRKQGKATLERSKKEVTLGLSKQQSVPKKEVTFGLNKQQSVSKKEVTLESNKQHFIYSEIVHITNNFDTIIGGGKFAIVYHGHLHKTRLAVKMLSPSSVQSYTKFQEEAKLMLRVQHRNLTALVGYCDEGANKGLIYKLPGKEIIMFNKMEVQIPKNDDADKNANILSWEKRVKIAIDAAQGLVYLHHECKPPIIHGNLKCTNVLIDKNSHAKITDYGLTRVDPADEARAQGYLDPKYNEKSDVFSFGMVLLELITGIPTDTSTKSTEEEQVIEWFSSRILRGDIRKVTDPRLQEDYDSDSLWKAVEVAMDCLSPTPTIRPSMINVLMDLRQCLAMEMTRTYKRRESVPTKAIELIRMTKSAFWAAKKKDAKPKRFDGVAIASSLN